MTIFVLCFVIILLGGYRHFKVQSTDDTWVTDLGYEDYEIYKLTFHLIGDRGCPEIPVVIGNDEYRLLFDTGCSSGIFFTNVLENKIDYTLLYESEEFNRDSSHRGWSNRVIVNEFAIYEDKYKEIETSISDWTLFSSIKFNGAVGLAYFKSQVITLDYARHRIGISSKPIDYTKLNLDEYVVLPLYSATGQGQEDLIFFEAEYNGESVVVYLDTGSNRSYVYNPDSKQSIADKPKELLDTPLKIGNIVVMLNNVVEVHDLAQADGLPYPTMIELNSDQLWKCNLIVTFDLIEQKIIFRKL